MLSNTSIPQGPDIPPPPPRADRARPIRDMDRALELLQRADDHLSAVKIFFPPDHPDRRAAVKAAHDARDQALALCRERRAIAEREFPDLFRHPDLFRPGQDGRGRDIPDPFVAGNEILRYRREVEVA